MISTNDFAASLTIAGLPVKVVGGRWLLQQLKGHADQSYLATIDESRSYLYDTRDGLVLGWFNPEAGALVVGGKAQAGRWQEIVDLM